MTMPKLIRADQVRSGDLITGTQVSGNYDGGPHRVAELVPAPEHSKRMQAYWLVWTDKSRLCYYGDTMIWLGQRP